MKTNNAFYFDYKRARPNAKRVKISEIIKCHEIGYLYWSRKYSAEKNAILRRLYLEIVFRYRRKYGLELNMANLGDGVLLVHPWNITMHNEACIGKNATLFKGATIGAISYGSRKGTPKIGDNVVIYANATVCGGITVGDNVIISAGAFVNFDVPDNSIVIGNPGVIHQRHANNESPKI